MMGDRAECTLSFHKDHRDKVDSVLYANDFGESTSMMDPDLPLIHYSFEEVNYATLPADVQAGLEDIDYDWMWQSGDNYGAGATYHRRGQQELTVYDHETLAVEVIEEFLVKLKTMPVLDVISHYENLRDGLIPPPLIRDSAD